MHEILCISVSEEIAFIHDNVTTSEGLKERWGGVVVYKRERENEKGERKLLSSYLQCMHV